MLSRARASKTLHIPQSIHMLAGFYSLVFQIELRKYVSFFRYLIEGWQSCYSNIKRVRVSQGQRDVALVSAVEGPGPYLGVGGMVSPFWERSLVIKIVSAHVILIPSKILKAGG